MKNVPFMEKTIQTFWPTQYNWGCKGRCKGGSPAELQVCGEDAFGEKKVYGEFQVSSSWDCMSENVPTKKRHGRGGAGVGERQQVCACGTEVCGGLEVECLATLEWSSGPAQGDGGCNTKVHVLVCVVPPAMGADEVSRNVLERDQCPEVDLRDNTKSRGYLKETQEGR